MLKDLTQADAVPRSPFDNELLGNCRVQALTNHCQALTDRCFGCVSSGLKPCNVSPPVRE